MCRSQRHMGGDVPPVLSQPCGAYLQSVFYIFGGCDSVGYTNQVRYLKNDNITKYSTCRPTTEADLQVCQGRQLNIIAYTPIVCVLTENVIEYVTLQVSLFIGCIYNHELRCLSWILFCKCSHK